MMRGLTLIAQRSVEEDFSKRRIAMARRSSTSTGSARSNETDPATDNAADPGAGNNAGADSGADTSGAQGGAEAPPPTKRRKRGPNKPKPGTFVVETKARMKHEEIIKLLTAHAVTQLGPDTAAHMMLQVNIDGECRSLGDVLPQGAALEFATVLKADE
jgi:hypothetical protein